MSTDVGSMSLLGTPVSESVDVRRAVNSEYVQDGEITRAAFSSKDLSLDVASLCSIDESRSRIPHKFWAELRCKAFTERGYKPVHDPFENDPRYGTNLAHAKVPGRINNKTHQRELANEARQRLFAPLSPVAN